MNTPHFKVHTLAYGLRGAYTPIGIKAQPVLFGGKISSICEQNPNEYRMHATIEYTVDSRKKEKEFDGLFLLRPSSIDLLCLSIPTGKESTALILKRKGPINMEHLFEGTYGGELWKFSRPDYKRIMTQITNPQAFRDALDPTIILKDALGASLKVSKINPA